MSIRLFSTGLTLHTWPAVKACLRAWQLTHALPCQGARSRSEHWNGIQSTSSQRHWTEGYRSKQSKWVTQLSSIQAERLPLCPRQFLWSKHKLTPHKHPVRGLHLTDVPLPLLLLSAEDNRCVNYSEFNLHERERPATRALRLKWAAQNGWMHISFHLEKRSFSYYRLSCHSTFNSHCVAYLIFHFIFSYYSEKEHPALRRETRWASLFLKSSLGSVTNKRCPGWWKEKCSSNL